MHRELIAILRGIKPSEVLKITEVLLETGITKIEIPLNSPEPYDSIELMVREFQSQAMFGAGTVLHLEEVDRVKSCGGELVVSPDCNAEVIQRTKTLGMISCPGVMTPTECFTALKSGADYLKFFPGSVLGADGLKAVRAVLPKTVSVLAVGGASIENFGQWADAGANGVGIGTALYKAGDSPDSVAQRATILVKAFDEAFKHE